MRKFRVKLAAPRPEDRYPQVTVVAVNGDASQVGQTIEGFLAQHLFEGWREGACPATRDVEIEVE